MKAVRAERTTTVRALIGAGMPRPDRMTGRIIEALARAGLLPHHAVLIGETAYQTYGGVLGVRLGRPERATTRDQPTVEIIVPGAGRSIDILAALRAVDPSFAPPSQRTTAVYRSATGIRMAVTSLDRSDDATAKLIRVLITNPVRAIVLHGPGIPVTVPAPERFASCALIDTNPLTPLRITFCFDPAAVGRLNEALVVAGRNHAFEQALADARSIAAGT